MQTLNAIQSGWEVRGSDDQKVGTVAEVGTGYLLLKKGLLFPKDIYIPDEAITATDPTAGTVTINVPKSQVENMGWSAPPEKPLPPIGGTTTTETGETFTLPAHKGETVVEQRTTAEKNAASTGWEGATEVVEDDFEREELRRKEVEKTQTPPPAR